MCRNLDLRLLLFYCLLSKFFSFFPSLFVFFLLNVLLSFLFLSNWFLFLSSFVFPLLFRHSFIPISLAHVVSSLAYPNLLGTKRLGCCCCCCCQTARRTGTSSVPGEIGTRQSEVQTLSARVTASCRQEAGQN
jgi:hypothetical protein